MEKCGGGGRGGGGTETLSVTVLETAAWRLASQKQGRSLSCDDVNLSEDELGFQMWIHSPTSLLTYRVLVEVVRMGALAILDDVTGCQLQDAGCCN